MFLQTIRINHKTAIRLAGTNLTAEREGRILFSGLYFSLSAGNLLTVNGPNGAGKSTLLRIIAGLYEPLGGSIRMEREGTFFPASLASHYLGDKNAMNPTLSVRENLRFWSVWSGTSPQNFPDILKAVGMTHSIDMPFGILSTGQKRRIALARLLVTERPLWILDEPVSGLDDRAADLFCSLMKRHLHSGGMIVAATHLSLGLPSSLNITLPGVAI